MRRRTHTRKHATSQVAMCGRHLAGLTLTDGEQPTCLGCAAKLGKPIRSLPIRQYREA